MVPVFNGLVTGRTVLCLRLGLFDNRISSLSNFIFHTQRCLSVEGVYYGHTKSSVFKVATGTCKSRGGSFLCHRVAKHQTCKLSIIFPRVAEAEKATSGCYSRYCFCPLALSLSSSDEMFEHHRLIRHHKHTITNVFLAPKK